MPIDPGQVPTGTVTFLFTDVVGSTRLWAADAEAMSASLRIHDQILHDTISKFSGHVFATAGDSFAAAFQRASAAVECAAAIQVSLGEIDWGSWPVISVRIGLHLGEAEERDGNYFGPPVNQAARVMAVAHGGQCVLTDGVRDAAGITATDLGVHTLRDIETPVHLNQLGTEAFPPLWSVGTGIVSLPSPWTSFVGREESVVTVRRLLAAEQLVTLTGVGGCGKTRLAIEVAHQEVPAHPEGVWFVDLAAIADDAAIAGAFATVLEVTIDERMPATDQLAAYLAPRETLLVVDNCEHVIEDVAELLDALLERCPRLRVLATSRESLEIDGEHTWKVPSLATGTDSAGAQLFVDRATAAGSVITLDDTSLGIIGDIVERLDGIPLAIELAAGRARSIDLAELRDRLDDRFRFLSGGKRRSRQRQATLEATVQWSYDLLSDDERSMLQCLSVFQGGFALGDVAAIADVAGHIAVDLVDALAAKSLIDATRDDRGQIRYRLLETIRLFALSRLIEADEIVTVRDRHLEHFLHDRAGASMNDWLDIASMERIDREFENFRSAAVWALEQGRAEATVRLAAMLAEALPAHGEPLTALEWLQLPVNLQGRELVFALSIRAYVRQVTRDFEGAGRDADEAIAAARERPCDDVLFAVMSRAVGEGIRGNFDLQTQLLQEGRETAASFGANVRAMTDFYWMRSSINGLRTEEAISVAASICEYAPTYGYRFSVERTRALVLVTLGRVDEADRLSRAFSAAPPTRIGFEADIIDHAIMVHTVGPEQAAGSLAPIARETVARRPEVMIHFLEGFGYIEYFLGHHDLAREISLHTAATVGMGLSEWLANELHGATTDTVHQIWRDLATEHPPAQRLAFALERAPSSSPRSSPAGPETLARRRVDIASFHDRSISDIT